MNKLYTFISLTSTVTLQRINLKMICGSSGQALSDRNLLEHVDTRQQCLPK